MGLVSQASQITATPSKVYDFHHPDGNDGSGSVVSWNAIPDLLQQQGGFSVDLSTYVNNPGGGTLTFAVFSGTLVGDWALSSTGNKIFSGTSVGGPTTFRMNVTKSGTTVTSPSFQVESIATSGSSDTTPPTTPIGMDTTSIANTSIGVKIDASADIPVGTQDCKGMKEMRFYLNGAFNGAVSMAKGLSYKFAQADTPPIDTVRRFPSGHVVSIPMFEATAADGDDATYPNGSIPGGSTGVIGGLSRTVDGPASPGVKMIVQLYYWKELETAQGVYDFSRIADDLKQCHALGVYLVVQIMVRTFNSSGGSGADNPAPNYLGGLTTPSSAHNYCTYYTPSNGGYQMWRWDTFVQQRYAALAAAIITQFDKNTAEYVHFAGVCSQETACNMADAEQVAAGYTITKYLAGLKAEVDAVMASTYILHYAMQNQMPANPASSTDTMTAKQALDAYAEYIALKGAVLHNPDILPRNSGLVNSYYPRYPMTAAKARHAGSMQNTSYESADSLTYTWTWGRDNLGLSQCWWFWKRAGAAAWYEHGTDKAIDVIAADYAANPNGFGPYKAGALTQNTRDYTVESWGYGINTVDGSADQHSSGRVTHSGDFTNFSAKVDSVTGTVVTNAYAGLSCRDAAGNDQRAVWLYVSGTQCVAKARSATGGAVTTVGTVAGVSFSTPTYLEIRRAGNAFTFWYSKTGLKWTQVGTASVTIAMTDPILTDVFAATGGGYAKVTAVFREVCLQNIAPVTYTYPSLTAGVQYSLTALGRDLATSPNDSAQSPALLVTTTGASITRKWDPGLYVFANGKATGLDDASTTFNNDITKISGMAGVKGICLPYTMAVFEPGSSGAYDFTILDRDINRCSSAGKKLAIRVLDRNYSGTTPVGAGVLPDYILNDVTSYGSGSDGTHGGYWNKSSAGYSLAVWRAQVMDRVIALVNALAAHLDPANGNPLDVSTNIAWVEICVTDLFLATGSDYTATALVTQLKRLMTAAVAAFPRTPFRLVAGTLNGGTAAQMSDLVNTAHTTKCAIGGLDIKGINTTLANRYFDAQLAWCGTLDGTSIDQRGSMPIIQQVNTGELTGSLYATDGSPYSNADLQSTLAFLGTNYAVWQVVNATGNGNWTSSVQPFLATNPATVTTRPTGW